MANDFVAVAWPSLTLNVIETFPPWVTAGVTIIVRFAPLPPKTIFPDGTSAALPLDPVTTSDPAAVSKSPTTKAMESVADPANAEIFEISLIVGRSFTAVTPNVKVVLVLTAPSLTLTVIVALPFWFAAGVTVTVRFAPLPPNTIFPFGTSVVLLLEAVTVREDTGVSWSPTVNATAPVAVSSLVV
jgi:hypothetical protein